MFIIATNLLCIGTGSPASGVEGINSNSTSSSVKREIEFKKKIAVTPPHGGADSACLPEDHGHTMLGRDWF